MAGDSRIGLALCRIAAAASAVLALGAAAAADAPARHEIRDPHYGDALFLFFQERYFTTLTTLMVSQHFGRVEHHSDEAEVLRGGMLLSYGLINEASAIFAQLVERGASPKVRDRAWFFLAEIRYQRGFLPEAWEALEKVEHNLPPDLEEDRILLQANLLMARNEFQAAADVLSTMSMKAANSRYARYNLGVALLKAQGTPRSLGRGEAVLDDLGRMRGENEEFRSLRDRANVALGFAELADGDPTKARIYFERVRLQGPQSSRALLGFGWAADALKDPKLALVPWTELAQRDMGDTAVLEAQIAVPYAYGEIGAYGQALQHYEGAISAFERESGELQASIKAIRSSDLIDQLVRQNPGEEMGWFWNIRSLPNMPHARHLAQLLAQHEFQEALKNYRDLRFLQNNLEEWRDKLVVFSDMLSTRRKAFADRLPVVRERERKLGLDALVQRRESVAAEIGRGEAEADGVAFADAKQLDLLARLKEIQRIAADPNADPEVVQARDRIRLVSGVLSWQLAQDATERIWLARKELQSIDAGLADAQRGIEALAEAQREEPIRLDRFAQRIAAISPLLQVMIPRVASLGREQRLEAQDIAIGELAGQQERIGGYTTQARFALAQLYDRAYGKKDAEDAAPAKP